MSRPPVVRGSLHDDALAVLQGWRAPDEEQEALRHRYVEHLLLHDDRLSRADVPAHLTAGALVVSADGRQVLLTLHAKANRWFHLGGHCEDGDPTLLAAAAREAAEESGLTGLRLDPLPLHLDAHEVAFCGPHERVSHLDVRFLALAPHGAQPTVSDESIDVRWWPVDALPTDDRDMQELVAAARTRLAGQRSSAAI